MSGSVDVDATIPAEWMDGKYVDTVVAFIRQLKIRPSQKRQLYARWAIIVGIPVDRALATYAAGVNFK